ncbi:U5 snRNP-specific protein-like factor [Phytophthora cinnamomi]|uniref:U5 snRNP-specific protein-like factor n=1 Tax=Phytophthora cinnamomi TaxID=4785 RepID=UPI00355A6774|nr:U5 snRNP-specific protein-like factor [Phytophthora cinnamomi]
MSSRRDYGGSSSRYASGGGGAFSIPDSDFQRDSTLKRRRQPSPPSRRGPPGGTIAMRARSKSKSRARAMARKTPGQHFIALGSNRAGGASTLNTNKASYYRPPVAEPLLAPPPPPAAAGRARASRWDHAPPAAATTRRNPSPVSTRTRSKSVTREREDTAAAIRRSQRERSKSAARRSGGAPLDARKEAAASYGSGSSSRAKDSSEARRSSGKKRGRSASRERRSRRSKTADTSDEEEEEKPRRAPSSSRGRRTSLQEIEDAIADTERELRPKKKELQELQDQLDRLKKRVEAKSVEVYDIEVELDALRKRRERRLPSHRSDSSRKESRQDKASRRSRSSSKRRDSRRSSSRARASKRPCIVDEDDEGSDDDGFVIMDPSEVKKEMESSAATAKTAVVPVEDSMPDHFWGRSHTPKLLANHRFRAIPDGSIRKGRHLAFNPIQPQIFATSPDEGGLILWSYQRQDQDIAKVVTLMPSSFRRENPCAEAISWSPDGNRMAMAFRDPVDNQSEFCVVQLHQLKLEDSDTPQPLPKDRLTSKRTSIHQRGISAIDWLPTGFGPETTSRQVITTGSSDHAVMLWEEHEDVKNGGLDLKFSVLHRDHRSEVRSLCVHSKRDCLYTGGLDGLMIRYDLNEGCTQIVIERRKPHISKINAVLEHPHNPNLLLVSCVEQSSHNLLLHDLRQPYEPNGMSLTWQGGTMSQYVVPRWSPAGYHVSCGSKTGVVNIWDVRMRGEKYPAVLPQQSLRVHHKTVLHATWHPRYDAMFSVSHDRTLGLLTFR